MDSSLRRLGGSSFSEIVCGAQLELIEDEEDLRAY